PERAAMRAVFLRIRQLARDLPALDRLRVLDMLDRIRTFGAIKQRDDGESGGALVDELGERGHRARLGVMGEKQYAGRSGAHELGRGEAKKPASSRRRSGSRDRIDLRHDRQQPSL